MVTSSGLLLSLLLSEIIILASCSSSTPLPDPIDRANQTLQGLFEYYWMTDPMYKHIQFFFSCGQIGGGGSPYVWNKCSCYNTAACVNCYRWWDAVAVESVATFGIYANTKKYSPIVDTVYDHSPYNSNWDAQSTYYCTFVDDFTWYGIAYLRAYEWLKVCTLVNVT